MLPNMTPADKGDLQLTDLDIGTELVKNDLAYMAK
jgi:hypothetical protein